MTEYERGFIDGIKSKVSAELTPTLINVSKTMLEMLKPVLSTALENALNGNNVTDETSQEHGRWIISNLYAQCSECSVAYDLETFQRLIPANENIPRHCAYCGADMRGGAENDRI